MQSAVLFLAGLAIILIGAEFILNSASRLAAGLGVKPILIGLTIVSLGTSMPELAVGVTAAAEGRGGLAVGNIAGTNMVNLLFILGLSALIKPLPLHLLSIKLDLPVMVVAALALVAMAWDGVLSRHEGLLLLAAAAVYTVALVRLSRRESGHVRWQFSEEFGAAVMGARIGVVQGVRNAALLVAGVAATVLGANLLVSGAVDIARALHVSDAIIGLTIVAIGTSAPELVTTVVATLKDDRDVAVGNLIGSSSYNILAILGATCLVSANGVHVSRDILLVDLPLAAAVALVCVPVFTTGQRISRGEGAFFIACYLAYLGTLVFVRA